MADTSGLTPTHPPDFNKEIFVSKARKKTKSQELFAKAELGISLQQAKVLECVKYIQKQKPKELISLVKIGAKINFEPLFAAINGLSREEYLWTRSLVLGLSIKYGDKAVFYAVLAELTAEKRDLEAAINDSLTIIGSKDPLDRDEQKKFIKSNLPLFQLSDAILKRDSGYIEWFFRGDVKQKSRLEGYCLESINNHPDLGEADMRFVRLCMPEWAVCEQISKASVQELPQILLAFKERHNIVEEVKVAFDKQPKMSLVARFILAADKKDSNAVTTLFCQARRMGYDPHELFKESKGYEEAYLADAIIRRDTQGIVNSYKLLQDPILGMHRVKKAIEANFAGLPECTSVWFEFADCVTQGAPLFDVNAFLPKVQAAIKDTNALQACIKEFKGNPHLLYAPLEKLCEPKESEVLWREIEVSLLARAIANGDLEALRRSIATLVDTSRPIDLKSFLQEAISRIEPANPLLEIVQKALASIDGLSQMIHALEVEGKRLNPLHIFEISFVALLAIEKSAHDRPSTVLQRDKTGLLRAIQVDFSKKKFYILSKKASVHKNSGTSKSMSGAIAPPRLKVVRLVNKRGKEISQKELGYLQKYGAHLLHSVATYTSIKPGKVTQEKTSVIMELFECDLCRFAGYAQEAQASKLNAVSVASICKQIGHVVSLMHAAGDIHRDLKVKNILYRINPDSKEEEVAVADFGLTYAGRTDTPPTTSSYGTTNFTSPEKIKGQLTLNTPEERLEQGIKDDLFALGCILYELLHQKRIPWGNDVRQYYKTNDVALRDRALAKYDTALGNLKLEIEQCKDAVEKRLLECCLHLVNPDPQGRLTLSQAMPFFII